MTGINEAKRRRAQNGFDMWLILQEFKSDSHIGDKLKIRVRYDGEICAKYSMWGFKISDTHIAWAEILRKYPHIVQIKYQGRVTTVDYTKLYFSIDKGR